MKDFLRATISFFSSGAHPVCETIVERLSAAGVSPESDRYAAQHGAPLACAHLAAALSSCNAIELTNDLAAIGEQLIWREAAREKISSFMADRHAFVQMIGPDAGIFLDRLRFGAFLLAPNTIYPLHAHAAEEVYVPISGSGRWRLHDAAYVSRHPGSIVHIPPWAPHAIRSGEEPLLMLWAWFGNIDFEAYRIEPNAFDESGTPL